MGAYESPLLCFVRVSVWVHAIKLTPKADLTAAALQKRSDAGVWSTCTLCAGCSCHRTSSGILQMHTVECAIHRVAVGVAYTGLAVQRLVMLPYDEALIIQHYMTLHNDWKYYNGCDSVTFSFSSSDSSEEKCANNSRPSRLYIQCPSIQSYLAGPLIGEDDQICRLGACLFSTYVPCCPRYTVKTPSCSHIHVIVSPNVWHCA